MYLYVIYHVQNLRIEHVQMIGRLTVSTLIPYQSKSTHIETGGSILPHSRCSGIAMMSEVL